MAKSTAFRFGSLIGLVALIGFATPPTRAEITPTTTPVPVKIERIKPKKEKHPTLRFLKANRSFLRSELDRLREKPIEGEGEARELDPRHLMYRDMLAAIAASVDSVRGEDALRAQRDILNSIAELAALEGQLDEMDRLLAAGHARLTDLDRDFVGRQVTALMILARGLPPGGAPSHFVVTDEDGDPVRIPLTADHVAALRGGGLAQVYHEFVEPREQVFELAVGAPGATNDSVRYLVIEPPRGQITFLEIDLATLGRDAGDLHARAWTQVAEAAPLSRTASSQEGSP
jgi:hypothetical protein